MRKLHASQLNPSILSTYFIHLEVQEHLKVAAYIINFKGVVRDTGGHNVALEWALRNIFGCKQNDVIFTSSDFGWAVGHTLVLYAPLFTGITSIIFEGKPIVPHPRIFCVHDIEMFRKL